MTIAAIALPLLLAALLPIRLLRPAAMAGAPFAAAPALLVALGLSEADGVGSAWALLGLQLGSADTLTRGFLLFTAVLWLAAGWFARTAVASDPLRARFWGFWLVTLAGNIGLVLAENVASFYVFFALMTFAAYGLIVHEQSDAARRASAVYLVMALLGEMLLLTAFVLLVGTDINLPLAEAPRAVAASPHADLLVGLLLAGFGVKAGALGLHVWLPLAHPVAPTAASAVLSGAMIKAGLLGWLRFLPLGIVAMPASGSVCVVAGFGAAFYGVIVGVTQRDPKTILAYSSVSQMGLMTAAVGVGLTNPATAVTGAILLYASHHALVKGALFLGTAIAKTGSRLVGVGLVWLVLDLAGAPLSSGALAKISLEGVIASPWLMSFAAAGTTTLLLRFLQITLRPPDRSSPKLGLWLPWLLLLLFDLGLFLRPPIAPLAILLRPDKLWAAAWPVALGVLLALSARALSRRFGVAPIPAGDVLIFFERLVAMLRAVARRCASASFPRPRARGLSRFLLRSVEGAERLEVALGSGATIGVLFLLALVSLVALLIWSAP